MSKASSSALSTSLGKPLSSETKVAESYWLRRQMSRHAEQSDSEDTTSSSDRTNHTTPHLSPKSRSLSDAAKHGLLQTSSLRDLLHSTKDDIGITSSPTTPQKPHVLQPSIHGLSLQVPRQTVATPGASTNAANRTPLSPKLDPAQTYGSPVSAIPRRSRGLDFSRACTNLHHSTLAESSPESSPNVGGRGINIPQRRGGSSFGFGSPGMGFSQQVGSVPGDRTAMSSSVSSVNMMESDTSSSEDDDDESMNPDRDDMMITATPQASKIGGGLANPFGAPAPSPGNEWMGAYSPAAASLLSFQRARFRKTRNSRQSSSSASGNSSKPSPAPLSPPVLKSIEASNGGYFSREMSKATVQSRRESLSLGTRDLHLSDLSDDGDSRAIRGDSPADAGPRGVIRRAVTRRGNLLPKPKTFARVRAALLEESAPLDSEAKREAEVIRQVRESDDTIEAKSPTFPLDKLEELTSTASVSEETAPSTSENSFSNQASLNSGGAKYWEKFDGRYRTPPPPGRMSTQSSAISEDASMDTPQSIIGKDNWRRSPVPQVINPPLASEFHRKRRRDDDLDPESFKRRAVSPGMSVQSSPVLTNSPIVKDGNAWIVPPKSSAALFTETSSSSTPSNGVKRVGLQGMTETNDGLMNMSIE
ncbi:hypothetical protein BGW36DRAFT_333773 [Talaromyces proteolyticus]|uniref:Uncharacterized protein n=1 Tax=Talaromyces proteolyticus TaxID=1131652 RepID=A0AAD4Q4L4_9EURO|nr:uncharacterized protein BGW36DRAFT_333773 [Talaromyces proteolyticus]KAH8703145.1 hypothetical protein BGW36DRAFT_333773 [Talaromyces proteolyticus]